MWVHRNATLFYFGDPVMMNQVNLGSTFSHHVQVGLGHNTAHNSVSLPGLIYSRIYGQCCPGVFLLEQGHSLQVFGQTVSDISSETMHN